MKRKLILLSLGLSFILLACGNDTKIIEGQVKTISTNVSETESIDTIEKNENTGQEDLTKNKGYLFVYNDILIEIDALANPIIEKLGEANSYFEAPSCAFEGIDKMYTYNSFEIDTYPMNDNDYVSAIIFKDDTITTNEGVGIGDSKEKLLEVYGSEPTNENGMLVYEKDEMKLCFIIQDDYIASVEYRSTVLDE